MRVAGIREFAGDIDIFELPAPGALRADELLIAVHAAGVGRWDDIARMGGWDLGIRPPMALGVEAAGVVSAVGGPTAGFRTGDRVLAHVTPLRHQGAWAEQFVTPVGAAALLPDSVPFETGAAFPVPALTAHQVLVEALGVQSGQTILVHGAGGVTGSLLVRLATHLGTQVVATAGAPSQQRTLAAGAVAVIDHTDPGWIDRLRARAGEEGFDAAVNAAPSGAATVVGLVRDGGKLATITSDPPPSSRGIEVRAVYVKPDGMQLSQLASLLASGTLELSVGAAFPLASAAAALDHVRRGAAGQSVVLQTRLGAMS